MSNFRRYSTVFAEAIAAADALLEHTPELFEALDAKLLALCEERDVVDAAVA